MERFIKEGMATKLIKMASNTSNNVLVTGGAGFIGSHLCERLLKDRFNVVCVDNFNAYYEPKRKENNIADCLKYENFMLYRADILNAKILEDIFSEKKIDIVIHLAAMAGVRSSIKNPQIYYDVNVDGTKNLLDVSVKYNIKKFIFGSSSSVYGENKKIPFSEQDEVNTQVSPYAKTKKKAEDLCGQYHRNFGLKITCLRFFTVYGPRGRPDMAPFMFVESIINNIPIKIYSSKEEFENGSLARDFTYVDDIINGIMLSVEKNIGFEIINLGKGNPIKINEFVDAIEKLLGKKAEKTFIGRQKGDVPLTFADISKARNLLGYAPKTSLEAGMAKFIEWYKKTYEPDT